MAENFFKPLGTLNAYKPDSGGAFVRSTPVYGIVKDNIDPVRAGRLKVFISDFNSSLNPDDSRNWVTVRYMSNFFGSVRPTSPDEGPGTYKHNPSSYGEWHAPPDIGTTVICIFINGDPNYGYYIGCVPDPETLHMVPAIGASFADQKETVSFNNDSESTGYGGAPRLPLTNLNTNNRQVADKPDFITSTKPVHSYTAAIMEQQGIIRDSIRGPISSSAQREAASRVGWGVSTPGRPIYEGGFDDQTVASISKSGSNNDQGLKVISRRGGHSIVMDDGDIEGKDQLVRIRTALGHQILMSDDGQTLMILHSNGQSYVELGKEGTVDVYSTNSVNVRTQGDLNLHADNDVNIHATKNLNIHAENMNVTTKKSLNHSIGLDWAMSILGSMSSKTVGSMSLYSTDVASFDSEADTYINGSTINLNSGKSPKKPIEVTPLTLAEHTDTLFSEQNGFTAAPKKLLSVTSRAPAHAPWAHAGQGVDVKVNLSASSQLPSSPSSSLSSVVQEGINSGIAPASLATSLSSPLTNAISNSLDSVATTALVGATAQKAVTGPLAAATTKGAAIVTVGSEKIAAVGAFAQTPSQMVSAGVLKPGSDRLVNSLVSSGANLTQSMPSSLFTGKSGAQDLGSYVKNVKAQTDTVVTNLQQAQTTMTNSGVITGRESAEQIAGVVFSSAASGSQDTVTAVKTSINKSTIDSTVIKDIGLATSTVIESSSTIGGYGGLTQAVNAMSASPSITTNISGNTGVVGASFSAINASFPKFKPGEATNLSSAVAGQQAVATSLSNMVGQASVDVVSNLNPSSLGNTLSGEVTGKSLLESTNIASGLINLPGGLGSISSFSDKNLPNTTSIPGAEKMSTQIKDVFSSAINNLPQTDISSALSGSLKNTLSGLSIGAAASTLAAVSSVKSLFGGKGGTRTPSIAVNTTDRTSIAAKTTSLLGDSGIPAPNFGGESNNSVNNETQSNETSGRDLNVINSEIDKLKKEASELTLAEKNSIVGDAGIRRRKEDIQVKLSKLIEDKKS